MRLKEKDFNLLKQGGSYIVGDSTPYTKPTYGSDVRDYVEFHVYDLNDNILKSGITRDFYEGNSIRLKPGDNLRKLGFISGKYKVVYNFFRQLAGANEVVLTHTLGDLENTIYTGAPWITNESKKDYWVDERGKVYIGQKNDSSNPKELDIKEYKYFIQEISPSRTEIRLAPLDIRQDKYKKDFETLYQTVSTYFPDMDGDYGTGTFAINSTNSTLIFNLSDTDPGFRDIMVGGSIEIKNAFIVGYQTTNPEITDSVSGLANTSGESLVAGWSYTQPGWDQGIHSDAVKPKNWSAGWNSGVKTPGSDTVSAGIGYHAKWVKNEGRNNSICMKFIDKNDQFVDNTGQSLEHRWLGINQGLGTMRAKGLEAGDQVKITWWQKTDTLGKGARVGLHHAIIPVINEPCPTEPPNNLDLNEEEPSHDTMTINQISDGRRWIVSEVEANILDWILRINPEEGALSPQGVWTWDGAIWYRTDALPRGFENNISSVSDYYVDSIGVWEKREFTTTIGDSFDLDGDVKLYIYGNKGENGILWVDDIDVSYIFSTSHDNVSIPIYESYIATIDEVKSKNEISVDQTWAEQAPIIGHIEGELGVASEKYPFADWSVSYKTNDNRELNTLLNFNNNKLALTVNYKKDDTTVAKWPHSIVYKLYKPLFDEIEKGDLCYIVREMAPSHTETVSLINYVEEEIDGIVLRSPNLESVDSPVGRNETQYKTISDILTSDTEVSEKLEDTYLSGSFKSAPLNIDYSQFENFINFSSVQQRIKNFYYKLQQIENNNELSSSLASNNNPATSSLTTQIQKYERNVRKYINEFDGFESYMYNKSSSFYSSSLGEFYDNAWPKTGGAGTIASPYVVALTSSAAGNDWYTRQLTSASLYDSSNPNWVVNQTPLFVQEDSENNDYFKFINMIGHKFDDIWSYINAMSDIYNRTDNLDTGISKELLPHVAKSLGFNLQDGKDLIDLPRYELGYKVTGSSQTHEVYSTKAEKDISREIWNRVINNMPYFLKTKGTIRSLRGLINCYGVPSTILRIAEYGGPDVQGQPDSYLIEQKFTKAIDFKGSQYVQTTWSDDQNSSRKPDTIEFRFKCATGSNQTLLQAGDAWAIRLKDNNSTDNYGHVSFMLSGSGGYLEISSSQLPIYDGEFYSVMLRRTILAPSTSSYINTTGGVDYNATRLTVSNVTDFPSDGKVTVKSSQNEDITLEYDSVNTGTNELVGLKGWPKRQVKTADTTRMTANVSTGSLIQPLINPTSDSTDQDVKYELFVKKYNSSRSIIYYQSKEGLLLSGSEGSISQSYNAAFTGSQTMYIGGNNTTFGAQFSGSMMEYRYWTSPLNESAFDNHVASPKSYDGNHASASYTDLVLRYSFDDNINHSANASVRDTSANQSYTQAGSAVGFANEVNYSSVEDEQNMFIPNIGANRKSSNKIRIETNKLTRNLSVDKRAEQSEFDLSPIDTNKTGILFAPTDVINEDIILSVANLKFDNYLGDPRDTYKYSYRGLNVVADSYWQKYTSPNNFWDYLRLLKYYDHSIFDQMKMLIPARTKATFGVLIEPNIFERPKVIIGDIPQQEELQHDGTINVSYLDSSNSTISMSGNYIHNEASSSYSVDTLQQPTLYSLSNDVNYATSSVTMGGPTYVFEEGEQPFISGSRLSDINQDRMYYYSSSLSQSRHIYYSSSYQWSEYDNHQRDFTALANLFFDGCLQTENTTPDGSQPVMVTITSPTKLTTTTPGESTLDVDGSTVEIGFNTSDQKASTTKKAPGIQQADTSDNRNTSGQ